MMIGKSALLCRLRARQRGRPEKTWEKVVEMLWIIIWLTCTYSKVMLWIVE